MVDNKFTEKDSIDLISQMLQQTKQNMKFGSGNILLYYGYPAVIIAIVVFILCQFSQNGIWSALWFLMFVPSIVIQIKERNNKPKVVTYMDKAINNTWRIVGSLFSLTVVVILIIGAVVGKSNFALMLPLCLLYSGIGISITGIITNVRMLIYTPLIAFVLAIYMLIALTDGDGATVIWHLYFGVSCLAMMIIPGHVLNKKSMEICSKN